MTPGFERTWDQIRDLRWVIGVRAQHVPRSSLSKAGSDDHQNVDGLFVGDLTQPTMCLALTQRFAAG
jgi:hypothetical protein